MTAGVSFIKLIVERKGEDEMSDRSSRGPENRFISGILNKASKKLGSPGLLRLFLVSVLISGLTFSAVATGISILSGSRELPVELPANKSTAVEVFLTIDSCHNKIISQEAASSPEVRTSDVYLSLPADLFSAAKPISSDASRKFYRVLRVVDGDTLEIESIGEVRLIGVDTPELYHPLKPVQFYAKEASEFVRNLVANSRVRIEYDREKIDKYGRTLVYVYLEDGRSLNEEIIRYGYGFAYTRFPFRNLIKYKKLETQAKEKGLGLWANKGLDEFRWVLAQKTVPYEIFELANNLWAIRYKNYVRLRLKAEELEKELLNLRQWTNEFSDRDLEKILLENGWLRVSQ